MRMTRNDHTVRSYLLAQDVQGYIESATFANEFDMDLQPMSSNPTRLKELGEIDVGSRIGFYDDDILTANHVVKDGEKVYRVIFVSSWGTHFEAIMTPYDPGVTLG